MAEGDYPVAPARMASLRDKDKNGSEKEKKRWFGKNKGSYNVVHSYRSCLRHEGCCGVK